MSAITRSLGFPTYHAGQIVECASTLLPSIHDTDLPYPHATKNIQLGVLQSTHRKKPNCVHRHPFLASAEPVPEAAGGGKLPNESVPYGLDAVLLITLSRSAIHWSLSGHEQEYLAPSGRDPATTKDSVRTGDVARLPSPPSACPVIVFCGVNSVVT